MAFPARGLHVPEWAAAGTKEYPVREPRAEWERTVDPARPHLASFSTGPLLSPLSLLPRLCLSSVPEPKGLRLPGWAQPLLPPAVSGSPAQEKEMRGEGLSPSVTLAVRAT